MKYGVVAGAANLLPSKSFLVVKSVRGSVKRKFTKPLCCAMKISWASLQPITRVSRRRWRSFRRGDYAAADTFC